MKKPTGENLRASSMKPPQDIVQDEGGDVLEKIRGREKESLKTFFGEDIIVPPLPNGITLEKYEKWKTIGFELHYLPPKYMTEKKDYPGWKEKPISTINLFKEFRNKDSKLASDTLNLPGSWVLVDTREKPKYYKNKSAAYANQMYANDPFKDAVEELRSQGVIKTSTYFAGVETGSRFTISWDELHKPEVKAKFAEILEVTADNLRLPRAIEWNFIGNAHYQKWGEELTWEWLEDIFYDSMPLIGGGYPSQGLSCVNFSDSVYRRFDNGGFRLIVVFPS